MKSDPQWTMNIYALTRYQFLLADLVSSTWLKEIILKVDSSLSIVLSMYVYKQM